VYEPNIVAAYEPATFVLKVATTLQVVPAVEHVGTLKVGAVNPDEAIAVKVIVSTESMPGKAFSAVAVIVAVGPAEPFVVVND